ncbi:hypothetical protein DNTS_004487 [Danionella cerebrum]|uniref:Tbk1/Ikki binding domain-containing protein n=1 Tax=Danionella cerebrum TaxID=2873325 RepID=A0A553QQB3_9TELE|nr:hypothetical protein DNTS_004487 [Danionella translucida]
MSYFSTTGLNVFPHISKDGLKSVMESPGAVDDDICILKHECVFVPSESPVAVCSGDESVASHFALVTAYEDIKKRLRDSERENTLLRRRIKQLEDRHFRPEAPPSEGPQYMNKAFSAYRVMKSLSADSTLDHWSQMEIQSLQQQLKRLQTENNALHTQDVSENCVDQSHDALMDCRSVFKHLLGEVRSLRTVVHSQSDLLMKMKVKKMSDLSVCKRAAAPVQCLDSVDLLSSSSSPLPLDPYLNGAVDLGGCVCVRRPAPLGHTEGQQSDLQDSNLEPEEDWSFPCTPRAGQSRLWSASADSNLRVSEGMPEMPPLP